ncbi:MAG: redox-regulated ATPase YchF [Candidatus Woesearchaeota archaeon]|nr:redox-regulated ATPase YchF [Candidatus Woesearchaeota archaeon]
MIIGVIGKANVGKSTFFEACTLADVEIANYPFATIKPNSGVGFVNVECADKFFNVQCNPRYGYCINSIRFVPIDMIDVAGLVPGAHEGKGMGLEFLNDLNQADALIHVIDVAGSTNEKGEPVSPGTRDPADDIKFLENELDYWYLNILKKLWVKLKSLKSDIENHKILNQQLSGVGSTEQITKDILKKLNLEHKKLSDWNSEELFSFASELRKQTKPMIIAANKIDIPIARENYQRLLKQFPDLNIIPCSAEAELSLKEAAKHKLIKYIPGSNNFEIMGNLNEKQKNGLEFIKTNILDKYYTTGVQQILNDIIFKILKYIPIFPGGLNKLQDQYGNTLPDCFLLKEGSTALDFAYKIHTDIGDNFIRAIDVKTKRTVGKEHILKSGDVIEIITNK